MRQRVLLEKLPQIGRLVGDCEVVLYEQDPWQAFIKGSATKGFFKSLEDHLNMKKIVVTSDFWRSELSKVLATKIEFGRMGIERNLTPPNPKHTFLRSSGVEFKGTLKGHRAAAFTRMSQSGLQVRVSPSDLSYKHYLAFLGNLQIFIHDESGNYDCQDSEVSRQVPRGAGLWAKELECASQGAFVIRNSHEDSRSYGLESIPLVKFYDEPENAVHVVEEIMSLSTEEIRSIQVQSVDEIRRRDDWNQIARNLTFG
jgi:hypothetical protein